MAIMVYSTETCPFCVLVKQYLKQKGVEFKEIDVSNLDPMITWGINPEQAIMIHERMPAVEKYEGEARKEIEKAYSYMGLKPGVKIYGTPIDVVFIVFQVWIRYLEMTVIGHKPVISADAELLQSCHRFFRKIACFKFVGFIKGTILQDFMNRILGMHP